jgi:hypothetical protein
MNKPVYVAAESYKVFLQHPLCYCWRNFFIWWKGVMQYLPQP